MAVSTSAIVRRTRAGTLSSPTPGQQHHHGADAGEGQQEGGRERRQERDVDPHRPCSAV